MAQRSTTSGSLPENDDGDGGGGGLLDTGPVAPTPHASDEKGTDGTPGMQAGPSSTAAASQEESLSEIFQTSFTAGVGPSADCHPAGHHHHHHHHDPVLSNGSYDVDGARLFAESDEEEEEEEVVDSLEAVFGPERGQTGLYSNGPCPPVASGRDVSFGNRQEIPRGGDWVDSSCFFPR